MKLPRLYAIIDRATLDAHEMRIAKFACALRDAGVTLVQYRDKVSGPSGVLAAAEEIAAAFAGIDATLLLNDRADLASLAGFGVHGGHLDLSPEDARRIVAAGALVGVSTHNIEQVIIADAGEADYIAIGPVFATSTKRDAEPVVGLEGVRRARALTRKPLIAIGGITRANARTVIEAGADSVAVISALFAPGETVREVAEDFLRILR